MHVHSLSTMDSSQTRGSLLNGGVNTSGNLSAHGPATPAEIKKLRKAAAEFEAMLISSWWSSMKNSGMSDGEDTTDPAKGTLDQLGMQAISSAISSGKGFGIGDMLVRGLFHSHPELIGGDGPQT
jgi:Rod binding domain-containing protein